MVNQNKVHGFLCNGSIGKSRLTSSIGPAIAQADPNSEVILIDLDLGGPSQEMYNKGIIKEMGGFLHEFLEGPKSIREIITETTLPNYKLILSDTYHKPVINKDSIKKLKEGIQEIKETYKHTILDIGSTFDRSSTHPGQNGDDLSQLIDLADKKILMSVANDEGKTINRGIKTMRDFLFYLCKKEIDDSLKNGDGKKYNNVAYDLLKKDYDTIDDFTSELIQNIDDKKVGRDISERINKTTKNLEIGIIFNQLYKTSDLFYNFIILGHAITNLSRNPDAIRVNNMNGYGHFSFDDKAISETGGTPITCNKSLGYKTLAKESRNAANYFTSDKPDKNGVFPDRKRIKGIMKKIRYNKGVMDEAYKKYIAKETGVGVI